MFDMVLDTSLSYRVSIWYCNTDDSRASPSLEMQALESGFL